MTPCPSRTDHLRCQHSRRTLVSCWEKVPDHVRLSRTHGSLVNSPASFESAGLTLQTILNVITLIHVVYASWSTCFENEFSGAFEGLFIRRNSFPLRSTVSQKNAKYTPASTLVTAYTANEDTLVRHVRHLTTWDFLGMMGSAMVFSSAEKEENLPLTSTWYVLICSNYPYRTRNGDSEVHEVSYHKIIVLACRTDCLSLFIFSCVLHLRALLDVWDQKSCEATQSEYRVHSKFSCFCRTRIPTAWRMGLS